MVAHAPCLTRFSPINVFLKSSFSLTNTINRFLQCPVHRPLELLSVNISNDKKATTEKNHKTRADLKQYWQKLPRNKRRKNITIAVCKKRKTGPVSHCNDFLTK